MPSLNQNFVRLEHDSFVLEYTSTDSILNTSSPNPNYAAWWGLSDNNTPVVNNNLLLESWSSTGAYGIDAYDVASGYPDCSAGTADELIPGDAPFTVKVFETKVIVLLQYDDFKDVEPGDYYHELVLMKVVNSGTTSTAHQCRSHVAATGILTVNESLFTNNPYR